MGRKGREFPPLLVTSGDLIQCLHARSFHDEFFSDGRSPFRIVIVMINEYLVQFHFPIVGQHD